MNLSMFDQEAHYLNAMNNGKGITPGMDLAYRMVREKLLLAGQSQMMDKQCLALVCILAGMVTPQQKATTDNQPLEKPVLGERPSMLTPDEDIPDDEWKVAAQRFQSHNGTHEYNGQRAEWKPEFKSKPGDPPKKWERGRPVSYIDNESGAVLGARFIKINPRDAQLAIVSNHTQKKNFSVPIEAIRLNDLSRPSTVPAAVQV